MSPYDELENNVFRLMNVLRNTEGLDEAQREATWADMSKFVDVAMRCVRQLEWQQVYKHVRVVEYLHAKEDA